MVNLSQYRPLIGLEGGDLCMDMDTGLDIIIAPNIEHEQNLSSEHWEQHQDRVSCSAVLHAAHRQVITAA